MFQSPASQLSPSISGEVGFRLRVIVFFESGKAIFELNGGNHHDHIVCVKCGRVEEFYDEEIEKRQKLAATARGFKMEDHALTIYGICEVQPCIKNKN